MLGKLGVRFPSPLWNTAPGSPLRYDWHRIDGTMRDPCGGPKIRRFFIWARARLFGMLLHDYGMEVL